MLRLATDEKLNGDIVRGVLHCKPDLHIVRVEDRTIRRRRPIGARMGVQGRPQLMRNDAADLVLETAGLFDSGTGLWIPAQLRARAPRRAACGP